MGGGDGLYYYYYYNLEINNLETYNFKILGKKNWENNNNNTVINNKPYVNWFKK